jgi:hypothetical protein
MMSKQIRLVDEQHFRSRVGHASASVALSLGWRAGLLLSDRP